MYLSGYRSGPLIAVKTSMDYEKMKALTEASRGSAEQRGPERKKLPKLESRPDWKYLDYVSKERMAA